jgi:hypothetical protein
VALGTYASHRVVERASTRIAPTQGLREG